MYQYITRTKDIRNYILYSSNKRKRTQRTEQLIIGEQAFRTVMRYAKRLLTDLVTFRVNT